jgi:DNA-binding transcriptional ArsR family regulator
MVKDDLEQRVFVALADPMRRLLIEKLSVSGIKTATEFARELPITRQGVSKHLKILEEAELVSKRQAGRERHYALTPQPLVETLAWVETVTAQWDKRLQALYDYLAVEDDEKRLEQKE